MQPISLTFNINSLKSIKNLYAVLGYIRGKEFQIRKIEKGKISATIWKYIRQLQKQHKLEVESELNERTIRLINELFYERKYQDPLYVDKLQDMLILLDYNISAKEQAANHYGETTKEAIQTLQKKYKLEASGIMDAETENRLLSAYNARKGRAESKSKALLRVKDAQRLQRVQAPLRLNMETEKVLSLQLGLSWLGYKIYELEYKNQIFGKSTRIAVVKYQKANGLEAFGHVDNEMATLLNEELALSNSHIFDRMHYRVRGAIRNDLWEGVDGAKVQVFEKLLRNKLVLLGEQKTFDNGFYDLKYSAPISDKTKEIKETFHLLVKLFDAKGKEVKSLTFFNAGPMVWANFTDGDLPYRGQSVFEAKVEKLTCALGDLPIAAIEESEKNQDVTFLYAETGIRKHEIMQLLLAHRIAEELKEYEFISPEIVYAFLVNNGVHNLPNYLLSDQLSDWDGWMKLLTHQVKLAIALISKEQQGNLLENAKKSNLIPIATSLQLDKTKEQLYGLKEKAIWEEALLHEGLSLERLMSLSKIENKWRKVAIDTLADNLESPFQFFDALAQNETIDPKVAVHLKDDYYLSYIATFDWPVTQALKKELQSKKTKNKDDQKGSTARDLAKWTKEEWNAFVAANKLDNKANRSTQAVLSLAETLQENSMKLFPDVALVAHVRRSPKHELKQVQEISNFLDNHQSYQLKTNHIEVFVKENPNVLSKEAIEEVKVLKRIHNISLSPEIGQALLENKIYSAGQIYSMGQASFVNAVNTSGQLNTSHLGQAFNQASSQYGNALMLASNYSFNQINPKAIINITNTNPSGPVGGTGSTLPDLESLFGSLDYCECQHCKSVYSPAAYLTDLLRFLGEKHSMTPNKTARDILLERRPDLDDIGLNCENAHTPMPYIDLVCEVLENHVAIAPSSVTDNFSHNSTLLAAQLKAMPEYEKEAAYMGLVREFSMHQQFNLWQTKTDLFLQHLGIPYPILMETWERGNQPNRGAIAAAYFGLSTVAKDFVCNKSQPSGNVPLNAQALDFLWEQQHDYSQIGGSPGMTVNKSVSSFLAKSKLTYGELLELLQLDFINPNTSTIIERPAKSCAVADQTLKNDLTVDKFSKMTRFIRLWRSTDWTMWELDLLIRNSRIGTGFINENCLYKLHQFHSLQQDLGLSVEELIAFYEHLDVTARRDVSNKEILPFYARLFLNPTINPDLNTFAISSVVSQSNIDRSYSPLVAAAVGADETLVAQLLPSTAGLALDLDVLTGVYRTVKFIQKLGISLDEFYKLIHLTGIQPFASLENTIQFLHYKQKIAASNFSIGTMYYLLTTNSSPLELSSTTIATYWDTQHKAILELRDNLFNADLLTNGLQGTSEELRTLLTRHLAKIITLEHPKSLEDAVDLVYGTGRWEQTLTVFNPNAGGGPNPIGIPIGFQVDAFVNTRLSFVKNKQTAKNILNPTNNVPLDQKITYMLEQLEYHFNRQIILEQVASNLDLQESTAHLLLNLDGLSSHSFYYELRTANHVGAITNAYLQLHKMAQIINAWSLSTEELAAYLSHYNNSNLEILLLTDLPIQSNPSTPLLSSLLDWWQFVNLDRFYNHNAGFSISTIWSSTTMTKLIESLAAWTGWDASILADTIAYFSWTLQDFKQYQTFEHLGKAMQQQQILGVKISQIEFWANRDSAHSNNWPTGFGDMVAHHIQIANEVQEAVKAKYSEDQWLNILCPIQDEIRIAKRDALVIHFTNRVNSFQSANDLFQHYLIDVEMSPCQMTSRLKQAISSVQLFVHRCIMHLESPVISIPHEEPLLESDWSQWKWMQNYRIWEANRKVFLYPENWIEPELRDNKSPFFKELEDELLQNELSSENAETAFANYLHKLDEVAHLEIMGMCKQIDAQGNRLIHVLGRTKEMPSIYYFRTYNEEYKFWTAWEKVETDIQGDHAIPYVYNNRVHIFWLEIIEKPMKIKKMAKLEVETTTPVTPSIQESPNQYNYKEIQLAWTIKKTSGWTPKTVSKKKLVHPWPRPFFSLHLRPRRKGHQDLWMDIYVSTSEEFNETTYYNPKTNKNEKLTTAVNHDETTKPWHSSSFVFDGFVRQVKLLAISGDYSDYDYITIVEDSTSTPPTQAPLQIHRLSMDPFWWKIDTNYGTYHDIKYPYLGDLNNKLGSTTSGGAQITNIFHHVFTRDFDVTISKGGQNQTFEIKNNSDGLSALNSHLAAFTPTTIQTITTARVTSKQISNSYEYVKSQFGKDGRAIELLNTYERSNNLEQSEGMHYEYNYQTNNKLDDPNDRNLNLPMTWGNRLLRNAKGPFRFIVPMEEAKVGEHRADTAFYQDNQRAFFIQYQNNRHTFYPFYHSFTRDFIGTLYSQGLDKFLSRATQMDPDNTFFFSEYSKGWITRVSDAAAVDSVSFDRNDAYALYNWELFFHAPLLIATQLSKDQKFEAAMQWFHYIFNPTNTERDGHSPQRYWITKPFFKHNSDDYQAQQIRNILDNLSTNSDFEGALNEWKNNPFKPHLVARNRPVVYQRTVVMKYIDNLIAWGDQLFRRDQIEAINQATLLYVIAGELLGQRPEKTPTLDRTSKTFDELKGDLDLFGNSNVMIAAEGLIASTANLSAVNPVSGLPIISTKYFCVPHNEKLLAYWDLVEDRLFKIRHCMNIDGIKRQLPLFAPPIDPALLVNAAAMGLDLGSVLDDLNAPRSNYRFRILSRTAAQFCSEVKSLGQSLLSALQTKDSEGMALLQSSNAMKILNATLEIKELQIEENKEALAGLEIAKSITEFRKQFYENREYMNAEETAAMVLGIASLVAHVGGNVMELVAAAVNSIPEFGTGGAGMGGSPLMVVEYGGSKISRTISKIGNVSYQVANILDKTAGQVSQAGSYKRRQEEWDLQIELAAKEIEQIDRQIAANKIRLAIVEKDLDTHKLQIENTKSEEAYLRSKYTNKELYSWMVTQISTTYFQAYQLAFDIAKKAEKSLRYELALPNNSTPYVQFGYWDSLKKGLLSGDKLMLAINKMEAAYLEQNKRELEITKQISLARLAPEALMALKLTGTCTFSIPEWWFDMDFPGHYMRRIKALSFSIPCIVGPYTNVNCSVNLETHKVRKSNIVTGSYSNINHYTQSFGAIESIAVSHAQNDSGLFELNFNDERYLPFEGAGVIGRWTLSLPDLEQFDYNSITDVVLHMRYTARSGGGQLAFEAKSNVEMNLKDVSLNQLPYSIISLKQEFATAWHRFVYPQVGTTAHQLNFDLEDKHYSYFSKFSSNRAIVGGKVIIISENKTSTYNLILFEQGTTVSSSAGSVSLINGMLKDELGLILDTSATFPLPDLGAWSLLLDDIDGLSGPALQDAVEKIDDIVLLLEYSVEI